MEVMTPGQHQQHYLAGALDLATGTLHHCLGARKTNALFRDLLSVLDVRYPAERYTRLSCGGRSTLRSIKPKPWSNGWPPTHGSPALLPTLLVPAPTRLSVPSAMCMTAAPATIGGNAYPIWWLMWKIICT